MYIQKANAELKCIACLGTECFSKHRNEMVLVLEAVCVQTYADCENTWAFSLTE